MADPARGAAAPAPAVAVDWFEREGSDPKRSRAMVPRVFRRSLGSWPYWVLGAILVATLVARWRVRRWHLYEATAVLRVAEGGVADRHNLLSLGELRDQLDELAFSRERILPLIKKYSLRYGKSDAVQLTPEAVAEFRTNMTIGLEENDFMEDDQTSMARRSARVTLSFKHGNNEKAYAVTRELAELVMASGLARQKKVLESEAMVARELATYAAADLEKIRRQAPGDYTRLKPAVERLAAAQKDQAAAEVALQALSGRQALSFELVDPGRVPPLLDKREVAVSSFLFTVFAVLLAGGLLAGAFDPRVLDGEDLASTGVEVLGRLPRLPVIRRTDRGRTSGVGDRPGRRV